MIFILLKNWIKLIRLFCTESVTLGDFFHFLHVSKSNNFVFYKIARNNHSERTEKKEHFELSNITHFEVQTCWKQIDALTRTVEHTKIA